MILLFVLIIRFSREVRLIKLTGIGLSPILNRLSAENEKIALLCKDASHQLKVFLIRFTLVPVTLLTRGKLSEVKSLVLRRLIRSRSRHQTFSFAICCGELVLALLLNLCVHHFLHFVFVGGVARSHGIFQHNTNSQNTIGSHILSDYAALNVAGVPLFQMPSVRLASEPSFLRSGVIQVRMLCLWSKLLQSSLQSCLEVGSMRSCKNGLKDTDLTGSNQELTSAQASIELKFLKSKEFNWLKYLTITTSTLPAGDLAKGQDIKTSCTTEFLGNLIKQTTSSCCTPPR